MIRTAVPHKQTHQTNSVNYGAFSPGNPVPGEGACAVSASLTSFKTTSQSSVTTRAARQIERTRVWTVTLIQALFRLAELAFGDISHVGLLTLTFADHVTTLEEAHRRFNSFMTNYGREHYSHYFAVPERTKKGRIHYHILVVLKFDIATGYDFRKGKRVRSACPELKAEWARLKAMGDDKTYGFGRIHNLEPIKNAAAAAHYVTKYVTKSMRFRLEEDAGHKRYHCSIALNRLAGNSKFQPINATSWRHKVKAFASLVSKATGKTINDMGALIEELGTQFVKRNMQTISDLTPERVHIYLTFDPHVLRDWIKYPEQGAGAWRPI